MRASDIKTIRSSEIGITLCAIHIGRWSASLRCSNSNNRFTTRKLANTTGMRTAAETRLLMICNILRRAGGAKSMTASIRMCACCQATETAPT